MLCQLIRRFVNPRASGKLVGGTAAAVTVGIAGAAAQGSVIYTDVVEPVNSTNTSQSVDFQNDDLPPVAVDYSLTSGLTLNKQTDGTFPYFVASSTSDTEPLALPFGATIDSTDTYSANTPATLDEPGGTPAGDFSVAGGLEYIGVSFGDPATYYGWIGFQPTDESSAADLSGNIVGFAYESNAGQGITAGAVPEPTSLALLALGAAGMTAYRRRGSGAGR